MSSRRFRSVMSCAGQIAMHSYRRSRNDIRTATQKIDAVTNIPDLYYPRSSFLGSSFPLPWVDQVVSTVTVIAVDAAGESIRDDVPSTLNLTTRSAISVG